MKRKQFTTLLLSFSLALMNLTTNIAAADDPPLKLDVWPTVAPGEKPEAISKGTTELSATGTVMNIKDVLRPSMVVYESSPEKKTGAAVLVCPGGGYNNLAYDKEGTVIAKWLNSIGVTAIVLTYRVPRREGQPKHLAPLQDAQRALRVIRWKAKQFKIDPNKIGVLGFSAGGHLAAMLSTSYDHDAYKPADPIDAVSSRPDFAVLIYPAYMHEDEKLKDEFRVTEKTPPAIMIHADNDNHSSLSSVAYYTALKKAGVPAAMHIFGDGGHGFGKRKGKHTASVWPSLTADWFRSLELIKK